MNYSYLEDRIVRYLSSDLDKSYTLKLKELFENDEDSISTLNAKINKVMTSTNTSPYFCSKNSSNVKTHFSDEFEAQDIQKALANLKSDKKIMQIGRGRGKGFIVFMSTVDEYETLPEASTPEDVVGEEIEDDSNLIDDSLEVDEFDTIEDNINKVWVTIQSMRSTISDQEATIKKLQEENKELSAKIEEFSKQDDHQDLLDKIDLLEKQVKELEAQQIDIELTTWR